MTTKTANPPAWADSKTAWLGRVHDAVLPSGMKVTFRDLSVAELAFLEGLPSDLLDIVMAEWDEPGSSRAFARAPLDELPEKPTKKQRAEAEAESRKILGRIMGVNRLMVAEALVEPKMTVAELEHVPMPDLEMIALFVNRGLALDAAGRRVGVVPVDQFQVVLHAHGHERCPAYCPACEEARRGLSTLR